MLLNINEKLEFQPQLFRNKKRLHIFKENFNGVPSLNINKQKVKKGETKKLKINNPF